jgi:hypothetical protein
VSAYEALVSIERLNDRHPGTDLGASEVLVSGDAQERDLSRE